MRVAQFDVSVRIENDYAECEITENHALVRARVGADVRRPDLLAAALNALIEQAGIDRAQLRAWLEVASPRPHAGGVSARRNPFGYPAKAPT